MKLIYSYLQKLLPNLNVPPQQLRDDLTMIGHFTNYFEEIDGEIVFDLDLKINRGDCLGYYGLARDLAVHYNLPLVLPKSILELNDKPLPITVTSADVTRVMAVKISGLKIGRPPAWLVNFVKLHNINSVNTVVDLTNYIMFMYGIPCHAFDATTCGDNLIWENNHGKNKEFITLDGTTLQLSADNLVISNPTEVLSTDLVGGKKSGTYDTTTEIIIEVATYNPSRIRFDSKELKTVTEASIRLEKFLDANTIPLAFKQLASLITHHTGGQISSAVYDYYPQPQVAPTIEFDTQSPSRISGIDIQNNFALDCFQKLGCTVNNNSITPPSIRKDITLSEDLAEEVIRFWGYQKIPTDQPLANKSTPDITPKEIYLAESLKDKLISLGYDEVLSWPLVQAPLDKNTAVFTQNSINAEYPVLRQSIIQSLQSQLNQYARFKLPQPQFFEVGKVYSKTNGQYQEKLSLGISSCDNDKLISDIENIFSQKFNTFKSEKIGNQLFVEIFLDDLTKPESYTTSTQQNSAIELARQIITLDANIETDIEQQPQELLQKYNQLIDSHLLWQIVITDVYHDPKSGKYRYTFRVSYYNCDDKTAKATHLQIFDLKTDKTSQIVGNMEPTKLLYYDDMYLKATTAFVNDIRKIKDQYYAVLDRTIFFPEGGGQPSDTGNIWKGNQSYQVTGVLFENGQVLHQIDPKKLSIGDQVKLEIDWNHRYHYMRIHSAGHLIHEAIMAHNSSLVPVKGFHQDEAYLVYKGLLDPSLKTKIENEANQQVLENVPILCDYTTYDVLKRDARSIPSNIPHDKQLRRLNIGKYPSMADGGVQVKSTREIGQVTITSIDFSEGLSKINYRVL
jgi:phenylalanyl-tRNA synthetase beta subunit/Ser-tRNA(Ala) deacylase AlaX